MDKSNGYIVSRYEEEYGEIERNSLTLKNTISKIDKKKESEKNIL